VLVMAARLRAGQTPRHRAVRG